MSGLLKSTDLKFIPGGEKIGLTRSIYGKANKNGYAASNPMTLIRTPKQAKRLPNGPERNAIYREMNRLFLVYSPWRLGVHRYYNDLTHPWVLGYYRHPVMRGTWKFLDIDLAKFAAAGR